MMTLIIALAAVANDPASKPDATAAASAAKSASTSARPVAEDTRRYCISETFTGSIITRKVCRTRAEWQRDGVTLRD